MYLKCFILLASCGASLGALNVTFFLTTPENPTSTNNFSINNYGNLDFNATRKYVVLCHGWLGAAKWYINATDDLMKMGDTNVIAVYYINEVSDPLYVGSALKIPRIGQIVGDLIANLTATKNISLKLFHLIGHSLGGHVVGIAGETIIKETNTSVARVTGLDPAFPGFYLPLIPYNPTNRISKGDGDFVEIIHTSLLGVPAEIGDADFFPNGGVTQTGCKGDIGCNHEMSFVYLVLSISDMKFNGTTCRNYATFRRNNCKNNSTALMGYPMINETGKFYLTTPSLVAYRATIADDFIDIYIRNLLRRTIGLLF